MAPTLRSLCVFASLLSTTFADNAGWGPKQATLPLYELGASNTGPAALPTPTKPAKVIALGIGFQNYTCTTNGTNPNDVFVQTKPGDGALARLYDVTTYLDSCNVEFITTEAQNAFEICLAKSRCLSSPNGDCQLCYLSAINYVRARTQVPAPQIGMHYFTTINGSQVPNFRVNDDFLSAKKVGDVKAPKNASTGSLGYGAVDWLYLTSNAYNLTHGLSSVYRVETAGGMAAKNCSHVNDTSSQPYAALYWFYT